MDAVNQPFPIREGELEHRCLQLSQENRDLTDYGERITKELRRYQAAHQSPPARPEDDMPFPPWAMNMQMMSPLLFAYEQRIAEMEAVIERSVSLAEQAQSLTKENDKLRAELQERTEQLRHAQLTSVPASGDGVGAEAYEELQELYRLNVEQVEALVQQNQLLKLQLERMQQNLHVSAQQSQQHQARGVEAAKHIEAAKHAILAEQERAEGFARQRGIAEQKREEVAADLAEELRLHEQLQLQYDGVQHELMMQRQSLELYRKSFEDRCALALEEEDRLKADLARSQHLEREHKGRLGTLEHQLGDTSEQLHTARRESEASRHEIETNIKVMESMDRKLKDLKEWSEQAQLQIDESNVQTSDLTREKERLLTEEMALKKQGERTEKRLTGEIGELKQQRDRTEESLKSAHQRQVAEMEERLRHGEVSSAELQATIERIEKQRTRDVSSLERQAASHATEKSRIQADLDDAHQARLRIDRQLDIAQQEVDRLKAEQKPAVKEAEQKACQSASDAEACRAELREAEKGCTKARSEAHSLQERLTDITTQHGTIQTELREHTFSEQEAFQAAKRRADNEKRALERQLSLATTRSQQEEQRASELMRAQEQLRARLGQENSRVRDKLEQQNERLSSELRAWKEKHRKLVRGVAGHVRQQMQSDCTEDSD